MKKALYQRVFARVVPLLAALLLVVGLVPVPVQGASLVDINSISIQVTLQENGDARITEVWDMDFPASSSATEAYITKHNLDEQEIWDLQVTDENGTVFTNIGGWDTDRTREQKAGECGLLETKGGYEICWGFGTTGHHVYTVVYQMSNVVKGYQGADAIDQWFLSKDLASSVPTVTLDINYPGAEFTLDNTRVWGFGHAGEIYVQDGTVHLNNVKTLQKSQYVAALVAFKEGMFSPSVERDTSIKTVRDKALKGSSYTKPPASADFWELPAESASFEAGANGEADGNSFLNKLGNSLKSLFQSGFVIIIYGVAMFAFVRALAKQRTSGGKVGYGMPKQQYQQLPYCRQLPFGGNINTTYQRLKDTKGISSGEGNLIGSYMLRWASTRQVEVVPAQENAFGNKQNHAIKLYAPRPEMPPIERTLYSMLIAAAGPDYILQNKELGKWSRVHYSQLEAWLDSVKKEAQASIVQMGAGNVVNRKTFFGLISYSTTEITPYGYQLTNEMYGFRKYLEDFTIINERTAREVELWDNYMVFAMLFGIADTVAQQFGQLYPAYFEKPSSYGESYSGGYNTWVLLSVSRSFANSAASGYRSGYNAAHSSSSSGGGGGFSGGGGGSSSGSGSSGGGAR